MTRLIDAQFHDLQQQHQAVGLGVWLFLASELLIFGVFFTAYAWMRYLYPDDFAQAGHHLYKWIAVANAAILLASSGCMAFAAELPARFARAKGRWLLATALLGSAFLVVKGVEYALDVNDGLLPSTAHFDPSKFDNPRHASLFLFFYWSMTALHALHVLVGVLVIGGLAVRAFFTRVPERFAGAVHAAGLYWHFVDIVWLIILPLLYLNP